MERNVELIQKIIEPPNINNNMSKGMILILHTRARHYNLLLSNPINNVPTKRNTNVSD